MFSFVMEWCWFHSVFLVCLELNYEIPFADNLLNKQNCNNRFRCHPGSLRMFATTRKQTNWSSFSKFPLNPLFPMTSNFLPWGNIWRALDSSSEDTTTIANINWTAALIMLLLTLKYQILFQNSWFWGSEWHKRWRGLVRLLLEKSESWTCCNCIPVNLSMLLPSLSSSGQAFLATKCISDISWHMMAMSNTRVNPFWKVQSKWIWQK